MPTEATAVLRIEFYRPKQVKLTCQKKGVVKNMLVLVQAGQDVPSVRENKQGKQQRKNIGTRT